MSAACLCMPRTCFFYTVLVPPLCFLLWALSSTINTKFPSTVQCFSRPTWSFTKTVSTSTLSEQKALQKKTPKNKNKTGVKYQDEEKFIMHPKMRITFDFFFSKFHLHTHRKNEWKGSWELFPLCLSLRVRKIRKRTVRLILVVK